ncbi:hypothetical protein RUM44_008512 [Polyplax serrata]|uniref:Uncharacterized protein n=1 Tax=Polyplax serrata TaxID=468196 RepID=A0ABR1BCN1_POLSC
MPRRVTVAIIRGPRKTLFINYCLLSKWTVKLTQIKTTSSVGYNCSIKHRCRVPLTRHTKRTTYNELRSSRIQSNASWIS